MYCLDTNVLINSWYFWYTPTSHPTFWKGIEELAKQNKLGFPHQVYEELSEQQDELFEWCKSRKEHLILEATDQSEEILVALINEFPDMVGDLGTGSSYADLYVIATAESLGWTVVTMEELSNSPYRRKWRIPNICRDRNIPFIQPYKLIQEEEWIFSH